MGLFDKLKNLPSTNSNHLSFSKGNFTIHPDLVDLFWIGDGKYKNYERKPRSTYTYDFNSFVLKITMYGPDEPSLLYLSLPVKEPLNPAVLERPPYYPHYAELTPEQRWMYWRFLSNPYDKSNDIGYVFIFYYGLERHLLCGKFEKAFNVILKLRNVYGNKSFQTYSSSALILSAMLHKRPDYAEKFLRSLHKDYEYQMSGRLYLLCKFGLNMPVTPFDIMQFHKDFRFTNNRYIKNNPDIFLKNLKKNLVILTDGYEDLYASQYFSKSNIARIPNVRERIFANVSIMDEEMLIPDITCASKFTGVIYKALTSAHEDTKKELALNRKKHKTITYSTENKAKSNTPKEILYTKWGKYEMPDPYILNISKGPRTDLREIRDGDMNDYFEGHEEPKKLNSPPPSKNPTWEYEHLNQYEEFINDKEYQQLTTRYYDEMNQIENSWSVIFNLKDFSGTRANLFIQNCKNNIQTFKSWKNLGEKYHEDSPPLVPAYKRLAMIYEKRGDYEKAISVCIESLSMNAYLDDSKGGMKGRLARMIRKSNRQPTAQELKYLE